jgi:hypothetical protein
MRIIITEAQYGFIEGIEIGDDGQMKLDVTDKGNQKYIDTSLGKSSKNVKFEARVTTLPQSGVKVISVYKKGSVEDKSVTDILKGLKRKSSSYSISDEEYDRFINRSAIFFAKEMNRMKVDSVFCMGSSSSLVRDIAERTVAKVSNISLRFLPDSIKKNIDTLELVIPDEDIERFGSDILGSLRKEVEKAKQRGEFEIKKIQPQYRKFFKGWIEVNSAYIKSIMDKDIILFDDYLTSGATLDEVCLALKAYSPKSITCFTIIKMK